MMLAWLRPFLVLLLSTQIYTINALSSMKPPRISFDNFIDCRDSLTRFQINSTISNFTISCTSGDSHEVTSCYESLGAQFMIDGGFKYYRGICKCKFLNSILNQFACAAGAYKAWISQIDLQVRPHGSVYPCSYAVEFPGACYRYVWQGYTISMRDAHILCLDIEDDVHRHGCIHGLGYAFSSKYFSDTGKLFPINILCSVGNYTDISTCIDGYWAGVNMSNSVHTKIKNVMCLSFHDDMLRDHCILQGMNELPPESPLFRPASHQLNMNHNNQRRPYNQSQAVKFLLQGVNQTFLKKFGEERHQLNGKMSMDIVQFYYANIGLNAMLYSIESDTCTWGGCHDQCHNIGKRTFIDSGGSLEVAIHMCGRACTDGCMHGVVSQWLHTIYNNTRVDLAHADLREQYVLLASLTSSIYGLDAFHALVHAFVATVFERHIMAAVRECKKVPTRGAQYTCAVGAYTQYFDAYFDSTTLASYNFSLTSAGLRPCNSTDIEFPAACYVGLWEIARWNVSLSRALSICDSIIGLEREMERRGCFHGMGVNFFKKAWRMTNHTLPSMAEVCSHGDIFDRQACIYGAVYWRGPFTWDHNILKTLCTPVREEKLRRVCFDMGKDKFNEPDLSSLFYFTSESRQGTMAVASPSL